jgi:integrase
LDAKPRLAKSERDRGTELVLLAATLDVRALSGFHSARNSLVRKRLALIPTYVAIPDVPDGTKICREKGIEFARRLLGHTNISTTQRYMHLDDRELAEAQDLVN